MKPERKQFIMNSLKKIVTEDKCKVVFRFIPEKSLALCNIVAGWGYTQGKGENGLVAFLVAFRYYEDTCKEKEKEALRHYEVRRESKENG